MQLSLTERDRRIVWHPYTQHARSGNPLTVDSASGAYLCLEGGQKVLDAISSWWVNLHGHAHPDIVMAIAEQAKKMEHVIFAGFTHEPAIHLAELLITGANRNGSQFGRVFFSDNGSTSVEVALKMAFQFHLNRGDRKRNRFLALRHAYHGDTFGAMAVGDPQGFHSQFRGLLPSVDFVEPGDIAELERVLVSRGSEYAAFIFEPLIQAAAGMKTYDSDFLEHAVQACRRHEILTVADEVFTGFYRTGELFAVHHNGVEVDMMCLSKGITGGFLPLAVTLATGEIYDAFLSSDLRTAFLHGHSYTANPIACAAAISSWDLLHDKVTQKNIASISERIKARTAALGASSKKVKSARCLGTIGAVELMDERTYFDSTASSILGKALEKGVLLRPLGNVIYTVPPYCCTAQEIDFIYDCIEEIIDEL